MMTFVVGVSSNAQIDFIEPLCGSGSFISKLLRTASPERISTITGVELNPRLAKAARSLWGSVAGIVEGGLLELLENSKAQVNLMVANPPYVRHHHVTAERKGNNVRASSNELGITVSQLAGLYVYFLLLAHSLTPSARTRTGR